MSDAVSSAPRGGQRPASRFDHPPAPERRLRDGDRFVLHHLSRLSPGSPQGFLLGGAGAERRRSVHARDAGDGADRAGAGGRPRSFGRRADDAGRLPRELSLGVFRTTRRSSKSTSAPCKSRSWRCRAAASGYSSARSSVLWPGVLGGFINGCVVGLRAHPADHRDARPRAPSISALRCFSADARRQDQRGPELGDHQHARRSCFDGACFR